LIVRQARGPQLIITDIADGLTRGVENVTDTLSETLFEPVIRLGVTGLFAQADDARRLSVRRPPIVWIESGSSVMGATERDLEYAVWLCRQSRPLELPSVRPETDGACSPLRFAREIPRRRAWTDAYGIDRFEVTHARWRRCVAAGRCPPARGRDDDDRVSAPSMPVTGVTWAEARDFCAFEGGRLPSDEEWERAARGGHRRHRFPWGRLFNASLANHGRSPRGPDDQDGWAYAAPVGSFPDGASPYGVQDMAGNVFEWTDSPPREEDVGPGADPDVYRMVRGGSWALPAEVLRVSHRAWQPIGEERSDLGLRCAYDRRALAGPDASAILRAP